MVDCIQLAVFTLSIIRKKKSDVCFKPYLYNNNNNNIEVNRLHFNLGDLFVRQRPAAARQYVCSNDVKVK